MRSRPLPPLLVALALAAPSQPRAAEPDPLEFPPPAPDPDEAAVLVKQARRLEAQGKLALASELYASALELDPADAETHRLLAENLFRQQACARAKPSFKSFVALAPPAARSGPAWDEALEHLAICLRSGAARIELTVDAPAKCAVASAEPRDVRPGDVASFEVPAGDHPVACTSAAGELRTDAARAAEGETRRVAIAFRARRPDDTQTAIALPPAREAARSAPPAPVAGAPKPTVLVVAVEGPGWACGLDDAPPAALAGGEWAFETTPGQHSVRCERAGLEPFEDVVTLTASRRHLLRIPAIARAAPPPAPSAETYPSDGLRLVAHGGISPALGTVGLGVGVRVGGLEVTTGTGLYPFALAVTYLTDPGATGLYLTGGYVRVGEGMLFGGSAIRGHGTFLGLGFELRPEDSLAWRIGLGVGANSAGTQSGPLTLDLSVVFLP